MSYRHKLLVFLVSLLILVNSKKNLLLLIIFPFKSLITIVNLLLMCSISHNDVPTTPQRNVFMAAVRGAVRPSITTILSHTETIYTFSAPD